MRRGEGILDDAVLQLEKKTGLEISIKRDLEKHDEILTVGDTKYSFILHRYKKRIIYYDFIILK